ncbi:MAG: hypothetical protein M3P18_16325 [Actinomycetota bacterium]|nr:hypothetical protein [Actinomycetota bacterium]
MKSTVNSADREVAGYLKELDRHLSALPRRRRKEVLQEIADRIDESRQELGPDHPIAEVLDRVGDPRAIALEAIQEEGVPPPRSRWLEIAALIFLLPGSLLLPIVGWLIGVILLWTSSIWTLRDKIIGTLILPGGLLPAFFVFVAAGCTRTEVNGHLMPDTCSGGLTAWLWTGIAIFTVVGPIAAAIYLGLRLRRSGDLVAAALTTG